MKIQDLIGLKDEQIKNTKLHLAIGAVDKYEPLYQFYREGFKEWQESQNKRNFERDLILSLIYFGKDEWLFAGVYKKVGLETKQDKFFYKTELLDIASDLVGRLIINFKKSFRQSYPYLENCLGDFELSEIRKERYSIEPFPGYENVKVKHDLLKSIILKREISWETALSNVKGVYLISDLLTGKLYVGSAYGGKAFWNRWTDYISNGHGDNKKLKELISLHGEGYANNFQYTILETRGMNSEDNEIIKRESFWKDLLLTREFGYNEN